MARKKISTPCPKCSGNREWRYRPTQDQWFQHCQTCASYEQQLRNMRKLNDDELTAHLQKIRATFNRGKKAIAQVRAERESL